LGRPFNFGILASNCPALRRRGDQDELERRREIDRCFGDGHAAALSRPPGILALLLDHPRKRRQRSVQRRARIAQVRREVSCQL
jgi:hypothetical protein